MDREAWRATAQVVSSVARTQLSDKTPAPGTREAASKAHLPFSPGKKPLWRAHSTLQIAALLVPAKRPLFLLGI